MRRAKGNQRHRRQTKALNIIKLSTDHPAPIIPPPEPPIQVIVWKCHDCSLHGASFWAERIGLPFAMQYICYSWVLYLLWCCCRNTGTWNLKRSSLLILHLLGYFANFHLWISSWTRRHSHPPDLGQALWSLSVRQRQCSSLFGTGGIYESLWQVAPIKSPSGIRLQEPLSSRGLVSLRQRW